MTLTAQQSGKLAAVAIGFTVDAPPAPPPMFLLTCLSVVSSDRTVDVVVDEREGITAKAFVEAISKWVGSGIVDSTLYVRCEHFDGESSVEMASQWDHAKREWSPWMAW